jgi:DNA-binding response OmpR family regulator
MSAPFLCESLSEHGPCSGGDGGERRLLLVDDDEHMVHTLEYYFVRRGFQVTVAATVAAAKAMYTRHAAWSLVISDYHLPDGNGWDFYRWIREGAPAAPPFLLISGAAVAATRAADVDFLAKPFSVHQLEARVATLISSRPDGAVDRPRAVRRDAQA